MTDDDRAEVKKIAMDNCESKGEGCAVFIMLLALVVFVGWALGEIADRFEVRITALETQVKELKAKP